MNRISKTLSWMNWEGNNYTVSNLLLYAQSTSMIHITQAGRSTPNIAVISEACNDYFDQLQAKDQREGHWIFYHTCKNDRETKLWAFFQTANCDDGSHTCKQTLDSLSSCANTSGETPCHKHKPEIMSANDSVDPTPLIKQCLAEVSQVKILCRVDCTPWRKSMNPMALLTRILGVHTRETVKL